MKFDFEKLNKSIDGGKANIDKIEKRAKVIEDLDIWAKENKNPLVFIDYGLENCLEFFGEGKIKKEVFDGLDENKNKEELIYIKDAFENFRAFVAAPIFTDEKENHVERRKWEEEFIENHTEIDSEAKKYYKSNRLNANTGIGTTAKYLQDLSDIVINPEIKEKLDLFIKKIPDCIIEKYKNEDGELVMKYYRLSNYEKIEAVKILTETIKKAIRLLEDK